MANDKTLSDVLLLLTKVSSKISDRVEKLEKIIGSNKADKKKEQTQADQKKQQKTDENISLLTKLIKTKFGEEQKKPEEVIEKKQEVIITSFGRDATKTLMDVFGGTQVKLPPAGEPAKEELGFLDKLKKMLPMLGLVLGGLAGLISSFMKGGFGEIWEKIKEGDFKGAFEKAKKKIYEAVRPILQSLPIIGPILSIIDGMEEMNSGNLVGGLKNFVQGMIGLLPIPIPAKAAIIGFVEMLGTYIEGKAGKEQIPPGSGKDIMAGLIKSVGLLAKTGLKFFKRIPIIGSLVSFYEAYEAFQIGGVAGISKGIINLGAGISNLFPGYGTAIAIGLDILSAFLFAEKEEMVDGKKVKKIDTRDWFKKTIDFITNSFPLKNLINIGEGIGDIINGDYQEGFTKIADSIPVFSFFMDMARALGNETVKAQQKGGSMTDFLEAVVNSILVAVVKMLPESFGIRYAAQKMLGVDAGVNKPQKVVDEEKRKADLTPLQKTVEEEAERRRLEEERKQASYNKLGTQAMMGIKANDFIKTSDGKLIIPNKDDQIIGFKADGPLDKLFTKNLKTSQEGNDILKKYADITSDIMQKQLKLLQDNNKLLNGLSEKLSTPTNIISRPTIVSNNFNSDNSLRRLQGAPAY